MVSLDDAVIARFEKGGSRYEILVDPDLVAQWKDNPENVDFEEMSYDILFELIRYMYQYPHSSFDMCIVQKDFNLLVSTAEYFMMDCFLHDLENYVLLHFAHFSSTWINKNKISFHHMPRLDTVFKKNHAAK